MALGALIIQQTKNLTDRQTVEEIRENEKIRNRVEGKFGEGKRKYGLNKIMTKLS